MGTWITASGFWRITLTLIILEMASVLLLVIVFWVQKKKFLWRLPLIGLCFQVSGFLFAMWDMEGKCISGEKQYYSTSIFQGIGLLHVLTGFAILVAYYFLRNISLQLYRKKGDRVIHHLDHL